MKRRVIIADDTEDMRVLLRMILDAAGWSVEHEAVDGQDARTAWLAASGNLDALVLDHQMPYLTGLALAEEVRAADTELPIVIVSAHLNPELRARAEQLNITCVDKIDATRLGDFLPA